MNETISAQNKSFPIRIIPAPLVYAGNHRQPGFTKRAYSFEIQIKKGNRPKMNDADATWALSKGKEIRERLNEFTAVSRRIGFLAQI
jgi:hypothetical protein